MQIITGTRREITIREWREILEKHMKRANDSMECFRRFSEASDLEHLIEDCEKILENAKQAKKAIDHMDYHGII
jgi:hypothetical protein